MGSNYFLINKKNNKRIHLGKSSLGWQFCFRQNEEYKPTIESLFKYIESSVDNEIWCDYGKITLTKFKKIIKDHMFGENFKTYLIKNPQKEKYIINTDFIAEDGTWWCKIDFC